MSNTRMKTFKVLVQSSSKNSIDIAYYIDENIRAINSLGIMVQMEKIAEDEMDAEMVEALRKRGITRFPALLTNDGKVVIGKDKIKDMFDRGIQGQRRGDRLAPGGEYEGGNNSEFGSNPSMTDFWMRELYSGVGRDGKPIPKKDQEKEEGDETADMERKLRDYQRNVPKHRRGGDSRDRDIDMGAATQQRRRGGRRRPEPDPDDNIADVCDNCGQDPCDCDDVYDAPPRGGGRQMDDSPRGGTAVGLSGDAMDDKMMAAWMANNPNGNDY